MPSHRLLDTWRGNASQRECSEERARGVDAEICNLLATADERVCQTLTEPARGAARAGTAGLPTRDDLHQPPGFYMIWKRHLRYYMEALFGVF